MGRRELRVDKIRYDTIVGFHVLHDFRKAGAKSAE